MEVSAITVKHLIYKKIKLNFFVKYFLERPLLAIFSKFVVNKMKRRFAYYILDIAINLSFYCNYSNDFQTYIIKFQYAKTLHLTLPAFVANAKRA